MNPAQTLCEKCHLPWKWQLIILLQCQIIPEIQLDEDIVQAAASGHARNMASHLIQVPEGSERKGQIAEQCSLMIVSPARGGGRGGAGREGWSVLFLITGQSQRAEICDAQQQGLSSSQPDKSCSTKASWLF